MYTHTYCIFTVDYYYLLDYFILTRQTVSHLSASQTYILSLFLAKYSEWFIAFVEIDFR